MLAMASLCASAGAAGTVRLVHGGGWDTAGAAVRKTLGSSAFKSAAKGRYVAEFVEESPSPGQSGAGSSLRLPALFALDEKGRAFLVIEGVPHSMTADEIVAAVSEADAVRREQEAKGLKTADRCGEMLLAMERYANGPSRVVSAAFRSDVFEELKRLDPSDETGWQRHFTMGDGLSIVERATKFRTDGDMAGGAAFLEEEIKRKPRRHLTREQQQALLMAQFALWREDESKRPEMVKLLSRIAAAGEDTFWGTAALGWLNILGSPPLSVYWGWRKGDFAPPRFDTTVKYGVAKTFSLPGDYEVRFTPSGAGDVAVEGVSLAAGDAEVASAKKAPFVLSVSPEAAGRITSMRVRGRAGADTAGAIVVRRRVLRPRKDAR